MASLWNQRQFIDLSSKISSTEGDVNSNPNDPEPMWIIFINLAVQMVHRAAD